MSSEEFILLARKVVLENLLNQQFGVSALADELGVSRSELYKRIKSAENKSASQFIREIRLEEAAQLLRSRKHSIAEVAYMVGFNSPTYFSTSFKEYFGFSPSVDKEHLPGQETRPKKRAKRWATLFTLGAVSLLILFGILSVNHRARLEEEKSLAVLKFDYHAADAEQSQIGELLSDEIINSLSNLPALKVITASSSFQVNKSKTSTEIGQRLGVDFLVDGSVRNTNNRLKVTIKFIDAATGFQLWTHSYEADRGSFFEMEADISKKVASEMGRLLQQDERFIAQKRKSTNLKALELYFDAVKKGEVRYEDSITQAIRWLEQSVELDPLFAEAYAELSFLYGQLHYYGSLKREDRDRMMGKYLARAMELNPESPEILLAKADYDYKNFNILSDSSEIISSFRRVLEMNPSKHRSSYRLYQMLRRIGKYHAAHTYLENALRLDPLNALYNNVYARDLFWKWDQPEKAFAIIQDNALKVNPSRGAIYFSAAMLADQPHSDYLSAMRVIQEALKQQPYTYGYLYWGRLLALDLDLVPVARKYIQLNQVKFPDNPIYTYEPAFQLCLIEKRYDDAIDLTRIWLEDKKLDKKIGYTNLAKVHYLKGEFQKSKEILLQHFSGLYEDIEKLKLTIASIQPSDVGLIKGYIEVLRKGGEPQKAAFFADFLCSYYKAHYQRTMLGKKHYPLDCYYVQNDIKGFSVALDDKFFNAKNRLSHYTSLKSSRYAAFEEKAEYQEILKKIETETHRMREEVITYLNTEDVWDPDWDNEIQ